MPGLIDMQVFTGEPGEEHRETLATASHAAAAGGVTGMVTMPNTNPVIDDAALVDAITRRARHGAVVRVHPMAALTRGCGVPHMTEFGLWRSRSRRLYRWRPRRDECADHASRPVLRFHF